ncbi:B12-binding domain-containing radical SAM protein [Candidatus Woesearchaeota archaeon]|jgi:anaerobic magnesium-protoporphyrin IX monomethyl ester cyclase|nr:B12-binding domain-containing radical SAM protein [Candidatus Woesearchaeota archaeon]
MKVLVINPPNMPFSEKSLLIEPIDVLTVATFIQSSNNTVKVIDMDVKKLAPKQIKQIIKQFQPELTIIPFDYHIPLHTSNAVKGVNIISKIAKDNNSKVIVGGKTPKHKPELFLRNYADIIINTEMEPVLKQLIETNFQNLKQIQGISYLEKNKLKINISCCKKINLDSLPVPDRSLIDITDYIEVRTILSSRGCFGKCGFCATPNFWGCWRAKSAENVVKEIEYLIQKFNAKKILFLDDNATVDKDRMKQISKLLIQKNIKCKFGCLGTISTFDITTMKLMHQAGFRWIHYGCEFASQKVLDSLKKGITPDQIKKTIIETKKIGFRVRTSWIFDLPNADEKGLKNTIELILKTQPDEIRAHFLALRVGSEYNSKTNCLKQQYIHNSKPNEEIKRDLNIKTIQENLDILIKQLINKNYVLVKNVKDWRNVKKLQNKNKSVKFISLCPSRYGVCW